MSNRQQAPGRADREGLTLVELFQMFPDDESAEQWFEQQMWPHGPVCPDCGSLRHSVTRGKHIAMPYRCLDCRQYFSVRKRSVMHSSKLGYQTWAIALYQVLTGLKGVSAMKIHRDLGIGYQAAWHLLHRIRKALETGELMMSGPIEVDETFVGGKEANKHESRRSRARGGVPDKAPVVGAKDRATGKVRAKAVSNTDSATLQGFVRGLAVELAQMGEEYLSALEARLQADLPQLSR
ncbi:MAG: IS1595 family transposase [Chloroflexi bacterium]|nr:IS1595 family transposase [Chloroflexota bacterium]MYF23146.1 IS1595 family transposase [Chloroflexota bacterium]